MLFGTIFGVIVVPGLYFVFGKLQEGRHLIRDEDENPLSEDFVESRSEAALSKRIAKIIKRIRNKNDNENNS
jgi:HAE1 family hydrophobic/amphiphilic exporter-1